MLGDARFAWNQRPCCCVTAVKGPRERSVVRGRVLHTDNAAIQGWLNAGKKQPSVAASCQDGVPASHEGQNQHGGGRGGKTDWCVLLFGIKI